MNHSKETNAGHVGPDKQLQTSLNDIERKATYCKSHKFENLYSLLNKWNLSESWNFINKRAARGIDKVSAKEFVENLTEEVTILEKELKDNTYHANLVRRTYIDKPNGDKRPLGIPTVKDKLLQTTCSKILEAIYEPKFYNTRYGYRKGKGAYCGKPARWDLCQGRWVTIGSMVTLIFYYAISALHTCSAINRRLESD